MDESYQVLETTTNNELDQLMKDVSNYRGCYPKDWCKGKKPWKEEYLILNTNTSDHFTGHWVGVCNQPGSKEIEYFDSFGLPVPEMILSYLKRSGKPVVSTTNEIQDFDSTACGYYVVMYLKRRAKGKDPYSILYSFDLEKQEENEETLSRLFPTKFRERKGMEMEGEGIQDFLGSLMRRAVTKKNFATLFLWIVGRYFPSYVGDVRSIFQAYGMMGNGVLDGAARAILQQAKLNHGQIVSLLNLLIEKFAKPELKSPLKSLVQRMMSSMAGEGFAVGPMMKDLYDVFKRSGASGSDIRKALTSEYYELSGKLQELKSDIDEYLDMQREAYRNDRKYYTEEHDDTRKMIL